MVPRDTQRGRSGPKSTPPTNRGVSYPLSHPSSHDPGALVTWRWDWYQATIRQPSAEVQAALLAQFGGAWLDPAPARLGYSEGFDLRDAEGKRAGMQAGGRNAWPNVVGSGDDAPQIAALLRDAFPQHEVTRFDAAQDFGGPGAWDRLAALALSVADEHKVKVEHAGDWHRAVEGRTLYIGARTSGVRCRVYEKGLQLRATRAPGAEDVGADVVRVEVQVRPDGRGRATAAALPPVAAWGFSVWSMDLAQRVDGSDVPRTQIRDIRASNDERALAFMVRQYGAMLARQAARDGMTPELLGVRLLRMHEANELRRSER